MKPVGISYEMWDPATRLVIDLEADEPHGRITCGEFASRIVHVAIFPRHNDGSALSTGWLSGVLDGSSSLDEWLAPVTNEPGSYRVSEGVKVIFRDCGIQTHNGFPQAHIEGPAVLRDEGPTG